MFWRFILLYIQKQSRRAIALNHTSSLRKCLALLLVAGGGAVILLSSDINPGLEWTQRWILRDRDIHLPWFRGQQRPLSDYYVNYPNNYTFILDEPQKCREQKPFLVVLVPVAPAELSTREVIRKTWASEGNVAGHTILTLFLLGLPHGRAGRGEHGESVEGCGQIEECRSADSGESAQRLQRSLREEQERYHDMIQGSFVDSYSNLTLKTMLMMEWLSSRCPEAEYAAKVDSDVYLNIPNLVSFLTSPRTPTDHFITGSVSRQGFVNRNPSSKWCLPKEVYPESNLPPYTLGFCYIFSMDLPAMVVEGCSGLRPVYIEDVALGLCLHSLGISPRDPPTSGLFRGHRPLFYNRCQYSTSISTILLHNTELIAVWEDLRRAGSSCV